MADKSEIRAALLLITSRTPWVTEQQHRTVDAAILDYFADTADLPADSSSTNDSDSLPVVDTGPTDVKVGDSA